MGGQYLNESWKHLLLGSALNSFVSEQGREAGPYELSKCLIKLEEFFEWLRGSFILEKDSVPWSYLVR
jgi:hypothetical protein